MSRVGRIPEGKPYTVKTILGYFTSWKTLLFTLIFSKRTLYPDMMVCSPRQQCNRLEVSQLLLSFFGLKRTTKRASHLSTPLPKLYVSSFHSSLGGRLTSYRTNTQPSATPLPLFILFLQSGSPMDRCEGAAGPLLSSGTWSLSLFSSC